MTFTRNIKRFRLALLSLLMSGYSVIWSGPIAASLEAFWFEKKASDLSDQLSFLSSTLPVISLLILLIGVTHAVRPFRKTFSRFIEEFLSTALVCLLGLSIVILYQEYISKTGFNLSAEHFGIIAVFIIFSLQHAYKRTTKQDTASAGQ